MGRVLKKRRNFEPDASSAVGGPRLFRMRGSLSERVGLEEQEMTAGFPGPIDLR